MSDRKLPELDRSFEQIITRILGRLTRLELRAWSGAVRSAQLESFNDMDATPQTVLSLSLTAGRWIVFQRGYCSITASGSNVAVHLHSVAPGVLVAHTPFNAGWILGDATIPFADFGEVVFEEISTIELQVHGNGYDTAVWEHLSLLALPV